MTEETNIQNAIMLQMSNAGLLVWRNHVGVYRSLYGEQKIKIGTPGQPDIMAILPVVITESMVGQLVGLSYNVEVKTNKGIQSEVQKKWQQQAQNRGAIYQLARNVDDSLVPILSRR